ncbi:MAG: hypothetical protein K1X94_29975 [Sandaracinaceae bacterium]|nr:hypothetical protein [Sandaracinaceae bacterium]
MSEGPSVLRHYLVGDRVLRVLARAEMATTVDALARSLAPLDEALVLAPPSAPELEVDLRFVRERETPPQGEHLARGASRLPDGVVLDTGAGWAAIRQGLPVRIEASVPTEPSPVFARWMLTVAVFVAVRHLGLFHLHSGLVETSEGGWLLVGSSGAAKSTTTLLLAASGLVPRADDIVLLDEREGRVFPVARPFHLSPDVVRAFPQWTRGAVAGARGKLDVPVARPDPAPVTIRAIVILLGPGEHTEIGPCEPLDALGHLLGESATLFVDPVRAKEHLDTLRRLVESVPLRTLRPGPEAISEPGRLRQALEEALRAGGS